MRTAAQKTATQIALRDYSKEAVGKSQYMRFWWGVVQHINALTAGHEELMSP